MKLKKRFYTNGIKTIKLSECDSIPDGYYPGRTFNAKAWNKGLTAETDDRVKSNTEACHRTRRERNNYVSWNTGLTKETSESLKSASEKISAKRKNNPMTDEQKMKMVSNILETKRKNNSFNKSVPEDEYYNYLLTKYSNDDVIRQYKDKRYPFACDFYIKSEDLFIECNFSWCHGGHPFDSSNINDINLLNEKIEKGKSSDYHKYAIKVWTESDPLKLRTLRDNKLNFMIIYPNGLIITK